MSGKKSIDEAPATGVPALSVRNRVLRNARRLLTNGAIGGGAFLTACYAVVDPLPGPCPIFSNDSLPRASAETDGRSVTVALGASLSGPPDNYGWAIGNTGDSVHNVQGGQLISTSNGLVFNLDPGAMTLSFLVDFYCHGRGSPVVLVVTVDLTEFPDGGLAHYPGVSVEVQPPDGGP